MSAAVAKRRVVAGEGLQEAVLLIYERLEQAQSVLDLIHAMTAVGDCWEECLVRLEPMTLHNAAGNALNRLEEAMDALELLEKAHA